MHRALSLLCFLTSLHRFLFDTADNPLNQTEAVFCRVASITLGAHLPTTTQPVLARPNPTQPTIQHNPTDLEHQSFIIFAELAARASCVSKSSPLLVDCMKHTLKGHDDMHREKPAVCCERVKEITSVFLILSIVINVLFNGSFCRLFGLFDNVC